MQQVCSAFSSTVHYAAHEIKGDHRPAPHPDRPEQYDILTCEQYEESLPAVETGTDLPVSDADLEAHPYWEYSEQNLCGAQMPMQI